MTANESNRVWVTECPRDAMQGINEFIPTHTKAGYLNQLLSVGFDVLDFGSFVSPKAIPQLKDTAEVLDLLDLTLSRTQLLAIVANERGAQEACVHSQIKFIGFPFAISETFQKRNTNSSISDSFQTVQKIIEHCNKSGKTPLLYISMAFGNPYGDAWSTQIAMDWIGQLRNAGVKHFALADTVGLASPEAIQSLTKSVVDEFNDCETGIHLHCHPGNWKTKVAAAFEAGCRRFDVAIRGFGGCPMAKDELVGNLATEHLLEYVKNNNYYTQIEPEKLEAAIDASSSIFLVH
ncbi:MAG TPA: hydroxymethylglutaryl-CoA lyase [Bacteroidia bacterium]|nr:hydroxymethylglutaryl-CoA lyase [Bacteroidia bacterium]